MLGVPACISLRRASKYVEFAAGLSRQQIEASPWFLLIIPSLRQRIVLFTPASRPKCLSGLHYLTRRSSLKIINAKHKFLQTQVTSNYPMHRI